MNNQNKVALITGISGQDGAYLAKLLLDRGYRVVGTSRHAHTSGFNNLAQLGINYKVELVYMDSSDFKSVLNILRLYEPQEIYHLSGQSSVNLSFDQPIETLESICSSTLNILEAIRQLGKKARCFNAASSECFGDIGSDVANELTPFRPRSPYAVAKASAFWLVQNYREAFGLYACSGILFNHESILRPERFVTQKIIRTASRIAAGSNEILKIGNLQVKRDWGWSPEYVEAMWLILQQSSPRDYIVATGQSFSLEDFVAEAFGVHGLDWHDHVVIDQSLFRPTELQFSAADPTFAETNLGWVADTKMPNLIRRMTFDQ